LLATLAAHAAGGTHRHQPDGGKLEGLPALAALGVEFSFALGESRAALRAALLVAEPVLDDVIGIGNPLEGVAARGAPRRPLCPPGLRPDFRRSLLGWGGLVKLPEAEEGGLLPVRELRSSAASLASRASTRSQSASN